MLLQCFAHDSSLFSDQLGGFKICGEYDTTYVRGWYSARCSSIVKNLLERVQSIKLGGGKVADRGTGEARRHVCPLTLSRGPEQLLLYGVHVRPSARQARCLRVTADSVILVHCDSFPGTKAALSF